MLKFVRVSIAGDSEKADPVVLDMPVGIGELSEDEHNQIHDPKLPEQAAMAFLESLRAALMETAATCGPGEGFTLTTEVFIPCGHCEACSGRAEGNRGQSIPVKAVH